MKSLVLVLVALAVAGLLLAVIARYMQEKKSTTITSTGPTVERLERLSHLATMRVLVADVLTGEGEGYRGSWLIKGDGLIGVDLGRAKIVEKDEATQRATVRLPQPEVLQSRVDHERTRTWEVKKTSWIPWKSDQDVLRDQVMREAQKLVAHAAASEENIRQAKTATESILRALYEEVGWQVCVIWEPGFPSRP